MSEEQRKPPDDIKIVGVLKWISIIMINLKIFIQNKFRVKYNFLLRQLTMAKKIFISSAKLRHISRNSRK